VEYYSWQKAKKTSAVVQQLSVYGFSGEIQRSLSFVPEGKMKPLDKTKLEIQKATFALVRTGYVFRQSICRSPIPASHGFLAVITDDANGLMSPRMSLRIDLIRKIAATDRRDRKTQHQNSLQSSHHCCRCCCFIWLFLWLFVNPHSITALPHILALKQKK
jgi:hypothetical protein